MRALLAIIVLIASFSAHADLVSTFKKLNSTYKGPFSLNYLQGTKGRVAVRDSSSAPGGLMFQAAFRNEMARKLAEENDFYLANLFTTNYYELTGKYVYGDQYGSFELNQQALLAAAPQAAAQAASMVRHWVLEKHYATSFHDSQIAKGFKLRGISGAEFEQPYAYYFFNFYLSAITEDYQFLPGFLLAKSSPISESSSLDRARSIIAAAYESAKVTFGEQDSGVKALYQLRNAVHNQLSANIVKQIDSFLKNYSRVAGLYSHDLKQVQDIIRSYYNVGPKRIVDLANKAGAADVQSAAQDIADNGVSEARLFNLSQLVTARRTAIKDMSQVPYENKTATLILMSSASQYLNKEIGNLDRISSKDTIKAVINLLYIEGFLIKDNWEYFASEVDAAADAQAALGLIPDVVEIANDTLAQAFSPALDQWLSVEPKMVSFVDNTIKSSALNTASIIAKKVK